MIRAHSVDTVRRLEAAAMAELPEGELMARAAAGIAQVAAARLDERDGSNVVALVGAGDNGGDALYAAHLLSDAGFACAVVLLPDGGRDAVHAQGLEAVESAGVTVVVAAQDPGGAASVVAEADVVLDGIVGIGGRPGLRPRAAALVDMVDDDAWVIAVDVASGLDPDGGAEPDPDGEAHDCVWADETVTMGTPKPAHLLPSGEGATGRLTVVDIGLELEGVPAAVERLDHDDPARLWPVPGPSDDKYSRGVLGIVAGGETYPGAAVLAVTAAAEAGVGMVRYIGTPTPVGLVRAAVPEVVVGDGRVQAWLVGPGLVAPSTRVEAHDEQPGEQPDELDGSPDARAQLRVAREALASELPVVVDAGGLDLLAELVERDGARQAPTLATPHAGELARLLSRLGDGAVDREAVRADPVAHARRAAALTGATILLKGSTTLVVSPDASAPIRSQADAPAWTATAGAGDVLAGIAGVLLASGLDPLDAGSLAALVHGAAADRASGGGPLRALEIARAVRPTVRDLLTRTL